MFTPPRIVAAGVACLVLCTGPAIAQKASGPSRPREEIRDPYIPRQTSLVARTTAPPGSVQVNVNAAGQNILGDAANESSLAIDPTNPNRMAIGWRQFDSVSSDFRQAGFAYSTDGGQHWTFPGVLEAGVFRSDPVLASNADGVFYYNSIRVSGYLCDVFRSTDGGATWPAKVYAYGGDKAWMTVDQTAGIGHGNIYCQWAPDPACCGSRVFTRSVDGGATWLYPVPIPGSLEYGTMAVGPVGELYIVGQDYGFTVIKSTDAQNPASTPSFSQPVEVNLGGGWLSQSGPNPNPGGLLGQPWIVVDQSTGPNRGNVYVLSSAVIDSGSAMDVEFSRSTDGGLTWSDPIRINDDEPDRRVFHWFGTLSIAPNGRLDAIWNDTRQTPENFYISRVYYSYSEDGGLSWSPNVVLTPAWDSSVGWPNQNKIGDYCHMLSDNGGANLAYAATFNGEQDVYFTRIPPGDCNRNGIPDSQDILAGTSLDCNGNGLPDECDLDAQFGIDCNHNGIPDSCDIASGISTDCDHNGIPDSCDTGIDPTEDCNHNNIPDACEIAGGTANDCNHNGIPDDCDLANGIGSDCNQNGVIDDCEFSGPHTSLKFDGQNDFVQLPDDLIRSRTTLTVEAWFQTVGGGVIFGYQTDTYPGTNGAWTPMLYVGTDGKLRGEFYNNNALAPITTGFSVNDGNWHHVALVGAGSTQSMYLDGQLVNSVPFAGIIDHLDESKNQIGIGRTGYPWPATTTGWTSFGGRIDEVRLWDQARTAAQIVAGMNHPVTGPAPGLVASWRFNEGSGQMAGDSSGNAYHGILGASTTGDASDPVWGIPAAPLILTDCNGNGIMDDCEAGLPDCNLNGVPDTCDLVNGTSVDCNGNQIPDECDLPAHDCDADGLIDECEMFHQVSSLNFDGINDYVTIPRTTHLEPNSELTIEAWIRPDSIGGYHNRIVRKAGDFQPGFILAASQNGDHRLQLRIDSAVGGSVQAYDSSQFSTYLGAWHHVAGVYSASGNYCRLYVDGILKGSASGVGLLNYSDSPLFIGSFGPSPGDEAFSGRIDEVRFWNVARSASQIRDSMFLPLPGNTPGIIGYWRLDEASGQAVGDKSVFRNNGFRGANLADSGDASDPAWVAGGAPQYLNDCNYNGILDACETDIPDCNHNGVPDTCDLANGTSNDCNGNLIPDECDLATLDCDADGIVDTCEMHFPRFALTFDGLNDAVTIARAPVLEPTSEFTVEAWIRPSSLGSSNNRIFRISADFGAGIILAASQSSDRRLQLRIDSATGGSVQAVDSTPFSSYVGQWHHVAGVYSVNANVCQLYVDGVLKAGSTAAGTVRYSNSPLFIGNGPTLSEGFDGRIDEIRFWRTVRTTTQLQAFKNLSLKGNEPDLIGYWRFNEGTGQAVYDVTTNHSDGFLGTTSGAENSDPVWTTTAAPLVDPDCNGNGTLDVCEGAFPDCNHDGINDICESAVGAVPDCNHNGVPDSCDIASGTSFDCNHNSVPDECEPDTTPPQPNPMVFDIEPRPAGLTAVYMRSVTALECASLPVQYFFNCVFTTSSIRPGHDSGWQLSTEYTDTNLEANSMYSYRIKARDSAQPNPNMTAYTFQTDGSTAIETPTGVSFSNVTGTSVHVTATGTFTHVGYIYTAFYFEMTPAAGSGANQWVTTPTVTVTGLSPGIRYRFRAKARNLLAVETPYTEWKQVVPSVTAVP